MRDSWNGSGNSETTHDDADYEDAEDEGEIDDEDNEEEEAPVARAPRKSASRTPARKSSSKFELPSVNVLTAPRAADRQPLSKSELEANSRALEGVLGDFGVRGEIVKANPGPVVTLYELEPAPGIKSSRVIGLADDIARSMSALSARVAVVAGRNAIGIELPNAHREKVYLRELLTAKEGNESSAKLPLCLGKNIGGESIIVDLARMRSMRLWAKCCVLCPEPHRSHGPSSSRRHRRLVRLRNLGIGQLRADLRRLRPSRLYRCGQVLQADRDRREIPHRSRPPDPVDLHADR